MYLVDSLKSCVLVLVGRITNKGSVVMVTGSQTVAVRSTTGLQLVVPAPVQDTVRVAVTVFVTVAVIDSVEMDATVLRIVEVTEITLISVV